MAATEETIWRWARERVLRAKGRSGTVCVSTHSLSHGVSHRLSFHSILLLFYPHPQPSTTTAAAVAATATPSRLLLPTVPPPLFFLPPRFCPGARVILHFRSKPPPPSQSSLPFTQFFSLSLTTAFPRGLRIRNGMEKKKKKTGERKERTKNRIQHMAS